MAPKTEHYLEKEANSLPAQNKTEPFLPSVPARLFAPGHPTAPLLRPQAHRALLIARIMSSYGSFGISSPKTSAMCYSMYLCFLTEQKDAVTYQL